MNILLFVTSLLMILSLLTYARIDNFRYFLGMQSEFERYMSTIERVYINKAAQDWYDTSRAKIKGAAEEQGIPGLPQNPNDPNKKTEPEAEEPFTPPTAEAVDLIKLQENAAAPKKPEVSGTPTSHMSVRVLFNQKMRNSHEDVYRQTRDWTKQLMKELYGKQKFFTDMMEKNGNFLDELLSYVENMYNDLPEDEQPRFAKDLANMNVKDNTNPLWEAFYLMLKGCAKDVPFVDTVRMDDKKAKILSSGEGEDSDEDDETDDAEEATEYTSPLGYDSILDYISLRNTTKIRVYSASRELLTVIFGSAARADDVINMRMALYRSVLQGLSASEATKQFQMAFSTLDSEDANTMLDFKVTKTNPSKND